MFMLSLELYHYSIYCWHYPKAWIRPSFLPQHKTLDRRWSSSHIFSRLNIKFGRWYDQAVGDGHHLSRLSSSESRQTSQPSRSSRAEAGCERTIRRPRVWWKMRSRPFKARRRSRCWSRTRARARLGSVLNKPTDDWSRMHEQLILHVRTRCGSWWGVQTTVRRLRWMVAFTERNCSEWLEF